jgi:hypothetical protein
MQNMDMTEAEIDALMAKDMDDLLALAGEEMAAKRLGAKPPSREKMIANAKAWVEGNRGELCQKLSQNKTIVAYAGGDQMPVNVEVFTAACDVVVTLVGGPGVTTGSAIIMKTGLRTLCPELKDAGEV